MTMNTEESMQTIAAGKFKAKCLAIMDDVQSNREPVIITKHGKPIAKLVPIDNKTGEKDPIFGFFAGKIRIAGDIEAPTMLLEDWKRLK
jgi:prevent-host-death family protein